jgi:hypothetical protein
MVNPRNHHADFSHASLGKKAKMSMSYQLQRVRFATPAPFDVRLIAELNCDA